jgi:MYXO-CTERM domain-containing protein
MRSPKPSTLRVLFSLGAGLFAAIVAREAAADLAVPTQVQTMGQEKSALVLAGYLDATLYGADPTGSKDSTSAIQQAIDDAMAYDMATYLPPGTYLVSDTLNGKAIGQISGCLTHTSIGTPTSVPQAPSLMGPASGPRPLLVLAHGASGFGDATNPKPLIHFWDYVASCPDGEQCDGWQGQADCLMWSVLRDVDLSLGSANAGAIGVQFAAAQYSYIENVSVTATDAYAGMQGVPSTDVVVNVAVTGGQYGIIPTTCCGISLVGVTLRDQTVAGLRLDNFAATMVTGFDIQESSGSAILNAFFTSQTSQVALLDGRIVTSSTTSPAIDNTLGHDLYVRNVHFDAKGALIASGSSTPTSGTGHDLVREYAYTNPASYTQSSETQNSYAVIDGVVGQTPVVNVGPDPSAPPSDLVLRHLPGALPWFADKGVVDVTSLGADPTGVADSTAAIQRAIGMSDYVFLPRGDYLISATLVLKPNTHLFGVPGMRSRLFGTNWDPKGTFQPYIQTADTTTGATQVGDLWLEMPESYASTFLSGVDWRAGRSSINRQVAVYLPWGTDDETESRKLVHIEANGGGRWYGLQLSLEESRTNDPAGQYRSLLVEGTTAPLTLYGPNPEHAQTEPEFEFRSVKNVRVLGIKTEAGRVASIESSDNVMFAAHSGHDGVSAGTANLEVSDSTNVVMPTNEIFSGSSGESPQGFDVLEVADGGTLSSVPANDQCSLFKRGEFDESPFPFCGDGVCDGAETKTTCAADCSPHEGDGGAGPDAGRLPMRDAGGSSPDSAAHAGPGDTAKDPAASGCACRAASSAGSPTLPVVFGLGAGLAFGVRRRRSRLEERR